jgi:enoyl-CoA hydratase/carnithine racemase
MAFETLTVHKEGGVLLAEIAAPPMNLLGSELVRDLVSLIQPAEADAAIQVLVFKSADPDTFISHVDVTRIAEYRAEAAKLTGEASIALLFRHLSASRLVTIAQIEGRVRAAGSEFVLACDMRFAARESAIFAHFDAAFGLLPGGGAAQHLTRLMGRAPHARGHVECGGLLRGTRREVRLDQPSVCPPTSSAISSAGSLIESPRFRPRARSRSRTVSMRSPSCRRRSSFAIPISSTRGCAIPTRSA